jgi:hypothetical protein
MSHPETADVVLDHDLRDLDLWIDEVYALQPRRVTSTPAARAILQRDAPGAIAMIRAYVDKLELLDRAHGTHEFLHSLANQLLKRELPFSEEDLVWFAERAARTQHFWEWPLAGMVTAMERHVAGQALSDRLRTALDEMRKNIEKRGTHKAERDLIERLNRLVGRSAENFAIDPGELWARQLQTDVAGLSPAQQDAWNRLLAHAQKSTGSQPSPEWIEEAARRIDAVGRDEFVERTAAWFALFGPARADGLPAEFKVEAAHDPEIKEMWRYDVSVPNGLLLKGLIRACRARPDPRQKAVLLSLMQACLHKTPYGKRFAEGATSCQRVLEMIG